MYNTYSRTTREYDLWHTGTQNLYNTHTHTHTCLTAPCPGLPGWAGTRKVKPIWILLKQEIVSGNGISWAICKSALRFRQITMPTPHYSVFLQAGCPSCRPTNSVKALWKIPGLPGSFWDGLAICLSEPATPTGLILSCRSPVFLATQDSVPW